MTVCGCHRPPDGVATPSVISSAAMAREDMPRTFMSAQHEGIGIGAQLRGDERHLRGHQPGDEGDVAGEPIELGNDDGAAGLLRSRQSRRELRPALQRIGALAGFNLNELARDGETLALAELGDGTMLRLQAQAGAALPRRRHADVGNCRSSQLNAPNSNSRYFTGLRSRPLTHARFNERCKRLGNRAPNADRRRPLRPIDRSQSRFEIFHGFSLIAARTRSTQLAMRTGG